MEPGPAACEGHAGAEQSRIRAARRDHGPGALGVRGVQLLGARHRQHGDARALRHRGAEAALADAAARRRDPLGLLHDRAGRRLLRRHQHPVPHRARRRRVRHQRPQMVVVRRRRSALRDPDRDGQDRSGQPRQISPAIHDPGAARHARRDHRAHAAGVRLRRRAARPWRGDRSRTCACRRPTSCSARDGDSRSRRAGSGRGASITACARSGWRSARSR